ncbi:hypothetical protein MKEN_00679800 [Mycena kentingensis (nom. inval.)]|nr:hypothetical protein MKEN_00679800 [Mycena kentingensis (nom. inval.)]
MPVILGTSPLHWGLASDCIPDRKPGVDNVLHLQYPLRQPTPAFPATVHPNPPATPPPGSRYPQGPTLSLKTDYNYYLNQCYTIPHREQTDAEQDVFVDELTAIITPPGTVPRVYDVQSRSWVVEDIAGMTAMPFGIPVAVDITPLSDNETTARLTAAACFDDACMQSLPDYPEIKAHLDELGNLAFGLDGGTPLSTPQRLPRVVLRVLEIGAMLWILLTRYALSMEERLASMFRAFDLNIFSIGGLLPTGLTGMQQNISSAWNGGDLAGFIGSVQGSWHVDIHDDANRWTMLIVLMKLPPGSDPGPFLLGRLGLYIRATVTPDGWVRYILFFKGNDLHTGIASSVDKAERELFLRQLAELYNSVGSPADPTINRVVFVFYPTSLHTQHVAPRALARTSTDNANIHHFYADEGSPALGSAESLAARLFWEYSMDAWNLSVSASVVVPGATIQGLQHANLPQPHLFWDENWFKSSTEQPNWLCVNPQDNAAFFQHWRGVYKRLEDTTAMYTVRISKAQIAAARERGRTLFHSDDGVEVLTLTKKIDKLVLQGPQPSKRSKLPPPSAGPATRHAARQAATGGALPSVAAATAPAVRQKCKGPLDDSTPSGPGSSSSSVGLKKRRKQDSDVENAPETSIAPQTTPEPVDDDSGASSEQDDTDLEGDDDEDMEAEDDVSFIVSTSVDIKSGDRFYTVRWSGYGEAADTKEPAASLQNSPLLLSSFEERQNNPSSYESLMTFAGKGAIHLANAFSRDPRLSTELSTLHKLRNDLISKAVSPASLHIPELLGDMELVEDIIHDFRAGFGQHELGRAVETVVQTSVLLGGVERAATESRAVTYVVNHLRAKAYMVFYDWHTNSGRTLARELVLAHRDQQLQERFPRATPAVTLVLDRLNAYAAVTMARVRAQPTTIAINVDVLRALWTSCPNGLDFKFAAKGRAALANERSKESWMVDTIYDFLTFNIVEPQISAACPTANSVYDLIFPGAVCTAIVDALDDDGIMSYPHLHEYLTTAKSLFGKGHTNRIAQETSNLQAKMDLLQNWCSQGSQRFKRRQGSLRLLLVRLRNWPSTYDFPSVGAVQHVQLVTVLLWCPSEASVGQSRHQHHSLTFAPMNYSHVGVSLP